MIKFVDECNKRRVAYAHLMLNNKLPGDMSNDHTKLLSMFIGGARTDFPCSNLPKPQLIATIAKALQSNNGKLPPVPREPTHMERHVIGEYKAEQRQIEQEQQASEAAETEALVDDADSATVIQAAVDNLPHFKCNNLSYPCCLWLPYCLPLLLCLLVSLKMH